MKTPTGWVFLKPSGSANNRYRLVANAIRANSRYAGHGIMRSRRGFARQARMPNGSTRPMLVLARGSTGGKGTYPRFVTTGHWRRVSAVAEPSAAFAAIDAGADWLFLWCGGGRTHASEPSDKAGRALDYAREEAISPAELERPAIKAARKRRSKTVVFAEMWEQASGQRLVVFHESGPHPLPERERPDRF